MAVKHQPEGSRRGTTTVDWEAAFKFYASLPAGARSYSAVAAEFGISPRTVEKHGRDDNWRMRLREIEAAAAKETDSELAQARAEEIRKIGRLIEASFIEYANKLRAGEVRMAPADLERLHRLRQQLIDELSNPHPQPIVELEPSQRTPEHTAAVVDALAEAGALEAFGLTRTTPTTQPRVPAKRQQT